jgi:putative tryptophan/tyrosine transport system substrate-binding protein
MSAWGAAGIREIPASQILNGAKASELPFQGPTRFDFAINMRAAKALGLTIPTSLLVAADEVIE